MYILACDQVDTVTPMTVDVSEGGEMTEHVIQKVCCLVVSCEQSNGCLFLFACLA